jgi:hypothetical protein
VCPVTWHISFLGKSHLSGCNFMCISSSCSGLLGVFHYALLGFLQTLSYSLCSLNISSVVYSYAWGWLVSERLQGLPLNQKISFFI